MSKRFIINLCVFAISLYLARKWKETRISPFFTGYEVTSTPNALSEKQNKALWDMVFKSELVANHRFESDDYRKRPDIIRHYLKHGGIEGLKEREATLKARLSYFTSGTQKLSELPQDVLSLISDSLRSRCHNDRNLDFDTSTFHFQVLLPGQTTGLRVDTPLPIGNSEYDEWLLSAAASSGLFRNNLRDSSKVLIFLNKWNSTTFGGSFVYYNKNELGSSNAGNEKNSLLLVTGTHTVHGISTFRSAQMSRSLIGLSDLSMNFNQKEQVWTIRSGSVVVKTFRSESLHASLIVDAVCEQDESVSELPSQSAVLETLKSDLESKGFSRERLEELEASALNDLIIHEYLSYPPPGKALIPFNYCSWIDSYPKVCSFLKPICA
uniref:2OG-FeII_Oxy_4 domain-containing protein n=1 Tax=Steinernema glaseri TaxID=37863 RepID=A0A1I7Z4D9_9BILA